MTVHFPAVNRRQPPRDDAYAPPEVRAAAEAEAAPRAVAVEPPADPAERMKAVLEKLEADMKRNPLDEIAKKVRALTYGEMIELASALWSLKPDGEISQEMLPGMLHKWSTGR